MKNTYKIVCSLVVGLASLSAHGAIVSDSCSNYGSQSICDACFKENVHLYTCNPHQGSCAKDAINNMSDTASNTGNVNLVMYDTIDSVVKQGTINFSRLQTTTSWTRAEVNIADMFETPASYFVDASASGQTGYQHFTGSNRYGHLLNPGASVHWVQMKSTGWLRPDLANIGTDRAQPAYRVTFTPRLFTDSTNYLEHSQCVYYFVRFCGDGTVDADKGEQCDDGNMASGDGCSSSCQDEVNPTCDGLTANPTAVVGDTSVTFTCQASNATSYQIIIRNPSNNVINTINAAQGTVTIPGTPDGTYSAECVIDGSITNSACQLTIPNTSSPVPSIDIIKDDSTPGNPDTDGDDTQQLAVGGTATFTIIVTNTGTEALTNVQISDQLAPNCVRSAGQTSALYSGGASANFDPGETFQYTCTFSNVQTSTFPNNTNTAGVTGVGVTSGQQVNDSDPSTVFFQQPDIMIIKDDADNPHNDYQLVQIGGTARFTITVRNNGSESLRNVSITDPLAPNCSLSSSQTPGLIQQVGNRDNNLDVGESFSYVCERSNVQENTFPNDTNEICTNAIGVQSGINVDDCNDTTVETPIGNPRIRIIKDDSDNHDDRQRVEEGDRARFDIIVTNNGNETIENVVISDPLAPDCDRTSSQTRDMIDNIGNRDAFLDPGESFEYSCDRSNVRANTFPNDTNRICVDGRGVGSGDNVDDCDETWIHVDDDPSIKIIKDDADNHDDRQRITSGEVRFDIAVINDGDVPLERVVIEDPRARECDLSSSETRALYPGSTFDPGERFGYTCRVFDVDPDDFPGGENRICVEARSVTDSGSRVSDCDETHLELPEPDPGRCERLLVDKTHGLDQLEAKFTCIGDARDRYRLDIMTKSGQILRTLSSSDGEFEHRFGVGEYKTACRVDDELHPKNICTQTIEVDEKHVCQDVRSSRGSYGPAPFTTFITCDARPQDNCTIEILKKGTNNVISHYDVCKREITFSKKGDYTVRCVINGKVDNHKCATNISVDSPTTPETGALNILLIMILLGLPAAFLIWRKRVA